MADLDDFFAKKDRKKSKAVKKFATADEMAKKLDEPKQKPEVRPKKERPVVEGEEPIRKGVSFLLNMPKSLTQLSRDIQLVKSSCRYYSYFPTPLLPLYSHQTRQMLSQCLVFTVT